MSTTIDERVVEMRFDNQQFESGVQTSLSTLAKLKQSLNLDGAAKGFEELGSAAKSCDMSTLSRSVETIQTKFSALETIAVGALLKIGSQAVTTGEQLIKSLSIDQITEGWDKYETKTAAVQTIMAATGQSIDEVSESLDKLNWFTDETSYSLTDMTTNIGKFTSQGVALDTAVTAMEGISTWASLSGQGVNEASRAMYNLSQALGVGAVKLQDWKSIENANMATKEFKELALEAAVAAGELTVSYSAAGDAIYKTAAGTEVSVENFSSTLSNAWFTSDVLLSVLENYGSYADGVYELYNGLADGVEKTTSEIISDLKSLQGADDETILNAGYTEDQIALVRQLSEEVGGIGQKSFAAAQEAKTFTEAIASVKDAVSTGWMNTFEIIFGNYEEAKVLWTDLANAMWDVFAAGGEARNEMLTEALGKTDIISYISELTGMKEDAVQSLQSIGRETGYLSDEFRDLANSLAEGDDGITSTVAHLLQMRDSGQDVVAYISELTGASKESIAELRQLGMETGYTSDEFKELASSIAEGDEALTSTITNLLKANELTGRELLVESFWNIWEGIGNLLSTIKDAFREIFPATTADQLYSFIEKVHAATERLKEFFALSDEGEPLNETFANIKSTFKGLFAVLDIVKQALSAVVKGFSPLISVAGTLLSGILGITGSFGDWLVNLDETIKKNDIFNKGVQKVTEYVQGAVAAVKEFASAIKEKFNLPSLDEAKESVKSFLETIKEKIGAPGLELLKAIFENLCERAAQVRDAVKSMKDGIVDSFDKIDTSVSSSKFVQVLTGIWNFVKKVAGAVSTLLGGAIGKLIDMLSSADFNGIIDLINGLSFTAVIIGLKQLIDGAKDALETVAGENGFLKQITGILNEVRGCFEAYQQNLKAGTLLKIASAIAILVAAIIALSVVDSEKLNVAIGAITMLFVELMAAMAVFTKISDSAKGMEKASTAMVLMSTSILILAGAMTKLADLEWDGIAKGLVGIAGCAVIIVAAAKTLSGGDTIKGAAGLVVFAAALKIMASACNDLAGLSWSELAIGLTGVGVLLAEIAAFLQVAKFDGKVVPTAMGIVILAAGIKVLASACNDLAGLSWSELAIGLTGVGVLLAEIAAFLQVAKFDGKVVPTAMGIVILAAGIKVLASAAKDFGALDTENLVKGLASVAALLAGLAVFTKFTSGSTKMVSIGTGLVIVAASMKIFASAVGDFGSMDIPTLAKGLVAMGVALAEVAVAMNFLPKNMVSLGTGLVIVGAALEIVANVLGKFSGFSWEEIGKGLATLGVALAELTVALNLMQGTLGGSAALLVACTALLTLIPTLKTLGGMSWESIVKGLVALAGAFTVIGVAATVLSGVIPAVLALGAGLALIGVGVAAAAAGLVLMAAGITALATALAAGATAIVAGLTVIITGIVALIPAIIEKLGEAIVVFCNVIAEAAPAIAEAVKAVVLALIDMLVECVPAIAEGVLALVTGVLEALVEYTPRIVDAIFQFLIGVLEGIARNLPELIQAVVDVFMSFFSGIVDALSGIDTDTLLKGIVGIGLLAAIMAALAAVAGLAPGAMVGVLAMGVVIAELALVLAAVGALAQIPGLNWLINEGGELLQSIGNAIGGFVGSIVGGFMSGVSSQFPKIGEDLSSFMTNIQPFVDGANSITPETMDGVKALAEVILLLTAADILEGLTSWFTGGSSLSGFAEELVPFGEAMMGFSNAIAGLDGELVNNAAVAGKTLAEMAATLPNSGGVVGFFAGENDMGVFGDQLVVFGEAMMSFAETVTGLDADVVVNAATAGKAMAEMAATLPNSGGVVGFFAGENDMDVFGEQLVPFGEAIMAYSKAVEGLDVEAVTNSATAGQAMVELAKTLPNSGGAVAFFTGENDIQDFGEQLVPFGEAIKAYSIAVAGLDVNAVTNSATAGQSLVELAKTIPNCGGLVSFFTGDNNIADFGDDIVAFGYDLAEYAMAVADVKPDVVTASASAAGALSELATNLPDNSVFDKWFGGDQTLADFGDDIADFGEDMGYYYSLVAGIDSAKLSAVIDQVWKLVDLAEGTANLDTSGFSTFSSSLDSLASAGLSSFIAVFDNSSGTVNASINTMLGYVVAAITNNQATAKTAMQTLVTGMITTISTNMPVMNATMSTMMTSMVLMIQTGGENAKSSFTLIITQSLAILNGSRQQFVEAGKNVTQGFVDGIKANLQEAIKAANQLAKVTIQAAQNTLSINSPSQEFQMLGMYVDLGLAKGINDNVDSAKNAATSVGSAIVKAFKTRLEIKSPSRVTKDEVGTYIVEGIAEGIEENTSAEDAAKQKAQNIVDAFKEELDKLSSSATTVDLEYELWEKVYGTTATDSEKEAKQLQMLADKIDLQTQDLSYAQAKYQSMLAQFGADSTYTQEAYQVLLQSQIDLADLVSEYNTAQSEATARNRQAYLDYVDYLTESQEFLLQAGFSLEQIQSAARSRTGYDPDAATAATSLDIEKLISDAMSNITVAFKDYAADTTAEVVATSTNIGTTAGEALGTGIQNGASAAVTTGMTTLTTACAESVSAQSNDWEGAASTLVDSFIVGIQSNTDRAAQSAATMAVTAYEAAIEAIVSESDPNTTAMVALYTAGMQTQAGAWTTAGDVLLDGFIMGLEENELKVTDAGGSMAVSGSNAIISQRAMWVDAGSVLVDGFIEGIQSNVERVAEEAAAMAVQAYQAAISAISSSSSSISSVVTMGSASSGGYSITPTVSIESAQVAASSSSKKSSSTDSSDGDESGGDTTYNFTQNNYSPTALNATTIYRQTSNQFAQLLKKVVS